MNQSFEINMKRASKTFIKGLLSIVPLVLTLYLLIWFAATAEYALGNIFKLFFPHSWYIKGFGFVLCLPLVYFFGKFLDSRPVRGLFNMLEELLFQIPIVKSIYSAIRDFTSLFSGNHNGKFKQVVLVNVPHVTGQQIGFITVSDIENPHSFITDDQVAVFLPFSYQMGGNTVIMSRKNVLEIDLSVEDALRFIATAGIVGNVNGETDKSHRL